jgi:predicted membrane protein
VDMLIPIQILLHLPGIAVEADQWMLPRKDLAHGVNAVALGPTRAIAPLMGTM